MTAEQISENFDRIRAQIAECEKKSGRAAGSVKLCAVSKFHPKEDVLAAIASNQFLFGENRVQEAFEKFTEIRELSDAPTTLHIIGQLQTNKVKKAVSVCDCIQSVDREDLLNEIEKQCARIGKKIQVYFELHTGEDSKSGYESEEMLLRSAENCANGMYPHIVPSGLMTMAPFVEDERMIRKSFSNLRLLKEKLSREFPNLPVTELSMGMSGDFKYAIEEGSTIVRVGTALFGERDYTK